MFLTEKWSYLKPYDLEKFAFHFRKCPYVVEAQKPDSETESQHFGVIQAFTLAHFIVRDPVQGHGQTDRRTSFEQHDIWSCERYDNHVKIEVRN